MSTSSSSLVSSDSSVSQTTPPAVKESKDVLWGAIAEFHRRKKQRLLEMQQAEEAKQAEATEKGDDHGSSSAIMDLKGKGIQEIQEDGSNPAAESLATESAALLAPRLTQQKSKKITRVKCRASARIAASRRARPSTTSGDKAKTNEVIIID